MENMEEVNTTTAVVLNENYQEENIIKTDLDRTFLQRMIPNELQKMYNKAEVKHSKIELESREKALIIVSDTKLQTMKEVYNDFLFRNKGVIRKDRTVFFIEQYQTLIEEVDRLNTKFHKIIERQYKNLDNISIPFLRDLEEKCIIKNVEGFKNTIDGLIDNFENILHEEVTIKEIEE